MKYLIRILKGIGVGIATIVPGMSGGTMAIVLGLYDDIIHSISTFFQDWKKNILFLLSVGFGAVIGVVGFSFLMKEILISFELPMVYLFMGVILGGIPVLFEKAIKSDNKPKKEKFQSNNDIEIKVQETKNETILSTNKDNNRKEVILAERKKFSISLFDILLFAGGLGLILLLGREPEQVSQTVTGSGFMSIVFLFLGGIILAVALVLPGISGSFVLLVFGLYDITLGAINNLDIAFLVPIGLGIAVGTLASTTLIEKLLNRFPRASYMAILGFVVGSLFVVFPSLPQGIGYLICSLTFVSGFGIMILINSLEKNTQKKL